MKKETSHPGPAAVELASISLLLFILLLLVLSCLREITIKSRSKSKNHLTLRGEGILP